MNKICKYCKYYAKDHSVCVNDASEHCADFVSEDDECEAFEHQPKSKGTNIAEVSIKGMKHSDFNLLEEVIKSYSESGIYYGRKDYHDKSLERLECWVLAVNETIKDLKIMRGLDD